MRKFWNCPECGIAHDCDVLSCSCTKLKVLRSGLTPEFLTTLLEAGKICGWSVDYVEVKDFIRWCFEVAQQNIPSDVELEPYKDEG